MRTSRCLGAVLLFQTAATSIVLPPQAHPERNGRRIEDIAHGLKRVVGDYVKGLFGLGGRDELDYYGDYQSYGSVSPPVLVLFIIAQCQR